MSRYFGTSTSRTATRGGGRRGGENHHQQQRSGSSSSSSSSFRRMFMTLTEAEEDGYGGHEEEYTFGSTILDLPETTGAVAAGTTAGTGSTTVRTTTTTTTRPTTSAPRVVGGTVNVEGEEDYFDRTDDNSTTATPTSTTDRDVTTTTECFDDSFITTTDGGSGNGIIADTSSTAVETSLVRHGWQRRHPTIQRQSNNYGPPSSRKNRKAGTDRQDYPGFDGDGDDDGKEDCSSVPILYYNGQDTSELVAEKRHVKMVIIASNVTKVEDQAFRGWTNLQRVVLEENHNTCNGLVKKESRQKMKLRSKLTIIGDRAFSDCTSLQDIEFIWNGYSKVEKIQAYAFAGCHSLKGDIKLFLQEQEGGKFQNADLLKVDGHGLNSSQVCFDDEAVNNEISIKDRSNSSLQLIGPYAFSRCSQITSIRIPDRVSYIGMGAFSDCASLQYVNLPTDIRVIGASTFARCKKFGSDPERPIITIPSNVTSIGPEAFWGCEAMKKIHFSQCGTNSSLKIIKNGAFQLCKSLKKVILPDSVQRIGPYAFGSCRNLEYVRLPPGLEKLEDGLFQHCKILHRIDCKAVTTKPLSRPSTCSKASTTKHVHAGNDDASILQEDFDYCGPLQEIGDFVFESSESIRLSSSSIALYQLTGRSESSGAVRKDDSIPDFPVELRSIGDFCFEGCERITYIDLQYMEVQSIGACAFLDCTNLMKVALSDGTKYVGERCFGGCVMLQDAMIAIDGTYGSAVFAGCERLKRFFDADGAKYSFRHGRSELFNELVERDDCADLIGTLIESGHFDLSDLTVANRDILSDKVYRSHALQRAIGCLGSCRFAVFFHMIDLYMNMFVTGLFIYVSHEVLKQCGHPAIMTRLLFIPIAYFAFLEFAQIRYDGLSYFVDVWNLGDWTRIGFITTTTCLMVALTYESDPTECDSTSPKYGIPQYLRLMIMFTGFVSIFGFILSLRSIFLPLAEFVGGIGAIFYKLIPFMFVSSLMLFMFGFMYFAMYSGTNNPDLEDFHFDSLGKSTLEVFGFFYSGPEITWEFWPLDIAFGAIMVVVLLNVVIAIVSSAWEDATSEGSRLFYTYRVDYYFELQAIRKFLFGSCSRPMQTPEPNSSDNEDEQNSKDTGSRINQTLLCHREVSLTDLVTEGIVGRRNECIQRATSFCGRVLTTLMLWSVWIKNILFILLGFLTCGITWSESVRLYFFGGTLLHHCTDDSGGGGNGNDTTTKTIEEKIAKMETRIGNNTKDNEEMVQELKAQLDVILEHIKAKS